MLLVGIMKMSLGFSSHSVWITTSVTKMVKRLQIFSSSKATHTRLPIFVIMHLRVLPRRKRMASLQREIEATKTTSQGRSMTMDEELVAASITKDVSAVKKALDGGANVNYVDTKGWTALLYAARYGQPTMVEILLLAAGANVRHVDNTNATPLAFAQYGHASVFTKLLTHGAILNHIYRDGNSSLHFAALGNQENTARYLVKLGANTHIRNNKGQTAADIFDTKGSYNVATYLRNYKTSASKSSDKKTETTVDTIPSKEKSTSINPTSDPAFTAFSHTIECDDIDAVRQLVKNGNPNCCDKDGMTPLHMAAQHGHCRIVQLLIDRGVKLTVQTNTKHTPLHLACAKGDVASVKVMMAKGAPLDIVNDRGSTPLHVAARYGHGDVVQALVKRGASLEQVTFNGCNVLHHAVLSQDTRTVKYLLQQDRVNINSVDKHSSTPLHYAVQRSNPCEDIETMPAPSYDTTSEDKRLAVLTLLLAAKGVDINAQNDKGETSLMVALSSKLFQSVPLLITSGADVNVSNYEGETPLFIASKRANAEILQQLLKHGARTDTISASGRTPISVASIASCPLEQLKDSATVHLVLTHESERFHECPSIQLHKTLSGIPIALPVDINMCSKESRSIEDAQRSLTVNASIITTNGTTNVEFLVDASTFLYPVAVKECLGDVMVFQALKKTIGDAVDTGASLGMRVTESRITHEALYAAQYAYLLGYRAVGDAVCARMTNPPSFDQEPATTIDLQDDIERFPYVLIVAESGGNIEACQAYMATLDEADECINEQIPAVVVREQTWTET